MKPEETVDYNVRLAWKAIAKMYNEQAAKQNNTMAEGFVLLNIDSVKGTPSTSLGPKMAMEPHSLSRTLKNMEGKGLIYRKSNPADGRSVLICLTDEGAEKRKQSKEAVIQFNNTIREKIPPRKLAAFFEVTNTVNKLISENKIYREQKV